MGFLDKIFGDQKNTNDVQQISTLTPEQRSLLDNLTKLVGGQVGQGVSGYGGQTVADVNANQSDVFGSAGALGGIANKALGASSTIMDYYDPAMSSRVGGQAESSLSDILKKFDPTAANDAFTKGVQAPTIAAWERDVLPKIMEKFAGANAGNSGAINRTLARSGADLSANLGASRATNLFNQQNAYEGRRLQGLGMAPSIAGISNQNISLAGQAASLGSSALSTQLGIGGTQRGIEQESLDSLLAKYETQQAYNNPWLKFLPTALNTTAFTNVVTPQLSERQQMMNDIGLTSQLAMGAFGMMGGGGGAGAGAGGMSTAASNPGMMSLQSAANKGYTDWFMQ
jgi:hypothetical protein